MHDGGAARLAKEGMRAEPLLSVRGVEKRFGGLRALDGVSIEVARRSITGLIGPNGAGKTTLFDVVSGLLPSDAGEILDLTDLAALRDAPAGTLSGGQKKLLELARVLMADPALILLDEPGAGVNPTLMRSLVAAIRELHARGMTFLLIEHDMDLITELCEPVIVLAEGRRLVEGPFAKVRRDPRVLEAYLGMPA